MRRALMMKAVNWKLLTSCASLMRVPFEELHGALVLLSGGAGVERAEVSALAGLWVLLA